MKAIEGSKEKSLERSRERMLKVRRESNEDLPIVLHSIDWTKEEHPPFFVSMLVDGLCLHNCIYDSGASSNVITKKVMNQLNSKITRPYRNVCAMDLREVEAHGIILGLQLKLAAYPKISFQMDILVIDVLDAWGMLLSRNWGATLGGNIQMDLSYATIPFFENSLVKLIRENERKYHVEDLNEPMNEFLCEMSEMGNYSICSNSLLPTKDMFKEEKVEQIWKMKFDGARSKSGKGAGIALISPTRKTHCFAFILEFDATNDVDEYEALLLGLEIAKDMDKR